MAGIRLGGVAVLPPEDPLPDVLYKLSGGSWWLAGNLAVPFSISQTVPGGSDASTNARLSPDLTEVVWSWRGSSHPDELRLSTAEAFGPTPDVLATNPETDIGTPDNSWADTWPFWDPAGLRVAFLGEDDNANRKGQIWIVNRDGTGLTKLYDRAAESPFTDNFYSFDGDFGPIFNFDGSRIAWWDQGSGPSGLGTSTKAGLWIMDDDGSSPIRQKARITDDIGPLSGLFAAYNQSDKFLIVEHDFTSSPFDRYIRVINGDGTGLTDLWSETFTSLTSGDTPNLDISRFYCMLPDDTGIVCKYQTYGTEPKDVIAILATDGSMTVTPISPERRIQSVEGGQGVEGGPIVHGDRIYWYDAVGAVDANDSLVSVALDGSDPRTDHDLVVEGQGFVTFY
jgi:hypothetical protein